MVDGDSLADAVARTYRAFAAVPVPDSIPYCDHCVSDEDMAALLAYRPLERVPARLLRPYLANLVVATVGSPADARHFAARALELLVTGELTWPELPDFARYLSAAAQQWPAGERAAVVDLLHVVWRHRIRAEVAYDEPYAAEVLNAAGHLTGDVAPLLDLWLEHLWPHGAGHLVLLLDHAGRWEDGRWRPWGRWRDEVVEQVNAWLRSGAVRESVQRRFDDEPGDDDATVLWATLVAT
jgi:hypothetical protein